MKNLYRRSVEGTIICIALVALIMMAFHPLGSYLVALCMGALAGVALWEYEKFALTKGGKLLTSALIFWGMGVVFSFFFSTKFSWPQSTPLIVLMVAILSFFVLHFGDYKGAVLDMALASFGLLYIAVPLGMMLGILYFNGTEGRLWMLYLLIVTKIADTGAYFGGNLWGKHKLAPLISPGKTIEGALVGLFLAFVASLGFYFLGWISWTEALGLGLLLGSIGQFGDLAESLLKRDAEKKDSNSLPGLGGALDALDSLLFNIPIVYLYLVAGY